MKTCIRDIRKEKRITQREIADRLNCTKSYISHLEAGRTSATIETIVQIADMLGVTLDELVGRKV